MKVLFITMVIGWIGFTGQTVIACYWWLRAIRGEKFPRYLSWRQYIYRIDENGTLLRMDRADITATWYAISKVY